MPQVLVCLPRGLPSEVVCRVKESGQGPARGRKGSKDQTHTGVGPEITEERSALGILFFGGCSREQNRHFPTVCLELLLSHFAENVQTFGSDSFISHPSLSLCYNCRIISTYTIHPATKCCNYCFIESYFKEINSKRVFYICPYVYHFHGFHFFLKSWLSTCYHIPSA